MVTYLQRVAGNVVWQAPTGGVTLTGGNGISVTGGTTIAADVDNTTINFNGANQLQVPNGGIDSDQIAFEAITDSKIPDNEIRPRKIETSGVTDGFVLTANGGQAGWAAPTVTGDGNNFVTGGTFDDATQEITLSSNGGGAGANPIDLSDLVTEDELTAAANGLALNAGSKSRRN